MRSGDGGVAAAHGKWSRAYVMAICGEMLRVRSTRLAYPNVHLNGNTQVTTYMYVNSIAALDNLHRDFYNFVILVAFRICLE